MELVRRTILNIGAVIFWTAIIFGTLYFSKIELFSQEEKSINVFMWAGVIDPKFFDSFEKETGIKVHASYFEGNEELLVKLIATQGQGYDMISPSDYVVEDLIKRKLLKKIDQSKLNFYKHINSKFLGHYFDPTNSYSIPAEWYLLGIATERSFHEKNNISWDIIFRPQSLEKNIGLINDSRELICAAVFYLYGSVRPINEHEVEEIKKLLIVQKKKVEAYTDFRGDFLLEGGNCSAVLVANTFSWKSVRDGKYDFFIPKEGTFLNLENYVIPATSTKEELVYQFMNYLFRLDVQQYNFEHNTHLSTRKDADWLFKEEALRSSLEYIDPRSDNKTVLFENVLTDEQVNEIWLAVKGR